MLSIESNREAFYSLKGISYSYIVYTVYGDAGGCEPLPSKIRRIFRHWLYMEGMGNWMHSDCS